MIKFDPRLEDGGKKEEDDDVLIVAFMHNQKWQIDKLLFAFCQDYIRIAARSA